MCTLKGVLFYFEGQIQDDQRLCWILIFNSNKIFSYYFFSNELFSMSNLLNTIFFQNVLKSEQISTKIAKKENVVQSLSPIVKWSILITFVRSDCKKRMPSLTSVTSLLYNKHLLLHRTTSINVFTDLQFKLYNMNCFQKSLI